MASTRYSLSTYLEGIATNNRQILSKAITLVESKLPSDQTLANQLLSNLKFPTKSLLRIGITGVPGVGKSTFIEAFGSFLTEKQIKVAVLSIDPSSQRTRGSIMGDKTRMETLAHNPLAYVRPSPTGGSYGGVTDATFQSILLCEAAGYEVIIVETVGVGQSETIVREMVDFFLLLMLPGAGDELQGIKRGIMEMADAVVINKADENLLKAKQAQTEYQNALHLFPSSASEWYPPVLVCSALQNSGISEVWETAINYEKQTKKNGFWQRQRDNQRIDWMHNYIQQQLLHKFYGDKEIQQKTAITEEQIRKGELMPIEAAEMLLALLQNKFNENS